MSRSLLDATRRPSLSSEGTQPAALQLQQGSYRVRLAANEADLIAALRLRFEVFNLELNEGLESAFRTGHDVDEFDAVCDHLLVEHSPTHGIVGTYRLQTGINAARNSGYYSEREFDFAPYQRLRPEVIELGRACIHRNHRSTDVLYLLWRGIARYVIHHRARYLIGCSSLTSHDAAQGAAVYDLLHNYLAAQELRTMPQPRFAMPIVEVNGGAHEVPKLLRTYLAIGARICGPPAIDRDFKTIDVLNLLDLGELHPRIQARFLK
jgi:putative hemolysin